MTIGVSLAHERHVWYTAISVIATVAIVINWCARAPSRSTGSAAKVAADGLAMRLRSAVEWRYLAPVLVFKAANWLQGPYFFAVYAVHLSPVDVNRVFIAGYASSMVLGTVASSITDVWGRKRGCILCGVLYVVSCASVHSPSLALLVLGRAAGGAASALLHTAFEAWFVSDVECAVRAVRGPSDTAEDAHTAVIAVVGEVQSWETFLNGIVSVFAGMAASEAAAARGSPTGAFELATLIDCVGVALIALLWSENFRESSGDLEEEESAATATGEGAKKTKKKKKKEKKMAMKTDGEPNKEEEEVSNIRTLLAHLWRSPCSSLARVGTVQALFGSSMYVFVLYWSPQLKHVVAAGVGAEATLTLLSSPRSSSNSSEKSSLPLGLVFSGFMVCIMLGSSIYAYSTKRRIASPAALASAALAVGGAALFCSALLSYATDALGVEAWPAVLGGTRGASLAWVAAAASFFVFEGCCGLLFPAMSSLRAQFVPAKVRATASSIFRIPLNLLVVGVLLSSEPRVSEVIHGVSVAAATAFGGGGSPTAATSSSLPTPTAQQCAFAASGVWLAAASVSAFALARAAAANEADVNNAAKEAEKKKLS